MERYRIQANIVSNIKEDEIKKRLSGVNICILDVDECMYSGFTQIGLAKKIFTNRIKNKNDYNNEPNNPAVLALWGAFLYMIKYAPLKKSYKNSLLQHFYSKAFYGYSREIWQEGYSKLWTGLYNGVLECVNVLSNHFPIGVISLGLDTTVESLNLFFKKNGVRDGFVFKLANKTIWENDRFKGIERPFLLSPGDKASFFLKIRDHNRHKIPLIIGHNRNEYELCKIASSEKGLSIAIGSSKRMLDYFDVVLLKKDWAQLCSFLMDLL